MQIDETRSPQSEDEDEEPDLHLEDVNQIFKGPSIG
jgi:hypothetical protein